MTNQLVCCKAPAQIDECGVCGGAGDTCGTRLTFTLAAASPGAQRRRRLLDGAAASASANSGNGSVEAAQIEADIKALVVESLGYPEELVSVTAAPDAAAPGAWEVRCLRGINSFDAEPYRCPGLASDARRGWCGVYGGAGVHHGQRRCTPAPDHAAWPVACVLQNAAAATEQQHISMYMRFATTGATLQSGGGCR